MDQKRRGTLSGDGENMRILKWFADRVHGGVGAVQTAVGLFPHWLDLDLPGLDVTASRLDEAFAIKHEEWAVELRSPEEFFDRINAVMSRDLEVQREKLVAALAALTEVTTVRLPTVV